MKKPNKKYQQKGNFDFKAIRNNRNKAVGNKPHSAVTSFSIVVQGSTLLNRICLITYPMVLYTFPYQSILWQKEKREIVNPTQKSLVIFLFFFF